MSARHRQCLLLMGTPQETAEQASAVVTTVAPDQVFWVGGEAPMGVTECQADAVKRHLGTSFEVVVLDLHRSLDANLVGQCHGFVWGGGVLILRVPTDGTPPLDGRQRFAVHPYRKHDVGHRFFRRFITVIQESDCLTESPTPCVDRQVTSSTDQDQAVAQLIDLFTEEAPGVAVVISDRGRGKSSALGRALSAVPLDPAQIAVTAAQETSAAEVFRFANAAGTRTPIRYVDPVELAQANREYEIIVVDEAAQLSVSLLQSIVAQHPASRIAFSSTARGYEGTGRGFALRFLDWLRQQDRPVRELSLKQPIRWAPDDPLEAAIYDALLLDAQAAPVPSDFESHAVEHVALDRDALMTDERTLRDYFGLLVHAHYRTTPGDLHRILDAPNLRLHALMHRGRVVAATLVALEGQLHPDQCEQVFWGYERLRGNALPETLISHSGQPTAGLLKIVRSIRIAVHPDLRRRGLATQLVRAIHQQYTPDLFGTLFGVTPELLTFRRSLGYELIRLGASRGSRTGEPTAVMLFPISVSAHTLMKTLRGDLARELPTQLALQQADAPLPLDQRLIDGVLTDLPDQAPLGRAAIHRSIASFAFGPRTLESVMSALQLFVDEHQTTLEGLPEQAKHLIRGRIVDGRAWAEVMTLAGLVSVPATMRAARRAVRSLVMAATPELIELKPPRRPHSQEN